MKDEKSVQELFEDQMAETYEKLAIVEAVPDDMVDIDHLKAVYHSMHYCKKSIAMAEEMVKQAYEKIVTDKVDITYKLVEIEDAVEEVYGKFSTRLEKLRDRHLAILRKSKNPITRLSVFLLVLRNK